MQTCTFTFELRKDAASAASPQPHAGEAMAARLIYLHGFASGPGSHKAQLFRRRFAERGVRLEVPDLTAAISSTSPSRDNSP